MPGGSSPSCTPRSALSTLLLSQLLPRLSAQAWTPTGNGNGDGSAPVDEVTLVARDTAQPLLGQYRDGS